MGRRRFDHLVIEISLAVGKSIPRYRLWMRLHDLGWSPEELSRGAVLAFCDGPLNVFLAEHGLRISPRASRRLRRAVRRFDPELPTPYDRLAQEEAE